MFNKAMYKQMIDFQKATFDNSYNAMVKMQEQGEAMLNMFIGQATWVPAEGKKVIGDWMSGVQKAREDFKKMVDEGFDSVENFSDGITEKTKSKS